MPRWKALLGHLQAVTSSERSTQSVAEHERGSTGLEAQTVQVQPRANAKTEEGSSGQPELPAREKSSDDARLEDEHDEAEAIIASQRETVAGLEANIEKQKQVINSHENTISSQKTTIQGYKLQVSVLEKTREHNERALEDQRASLETHAEATRTRSSTVESLQATVESQQQVIKGHELTIRSQKKAIGNHEMDMNVLQRAIDDRDRAQDEREVKWRAEGSSSEASGTATKAQQEAITALQGERDKLRHAVKTKEAVITDLRLIIAAQQKAKVSKAPIYSTHMSAARTEELQKKIASLEGANDALYQQINTLKLTTAGVSNQASVRNDLGAGRFERNRMAAVLTNMQGGVRWDGWEGRGFAFDPMERR